MHIQWQSKGARKYRKSIVIYSISMVGLMSSWVVGYVLKWRSKIEAKILLLLEI